MAGEWIPVDIAIGEKPEVLELCEVADVEVEVAVFRLFKLWSWFAINSADGTARATPKRLAAVCGGDAEFWLAVESVGWLSFCQEAKTATVPGWDRRFSQSAKARALNARRQDSYRKAHNSAEKQQSNASVTVQRYENNASVDDAALPEERRGEDNSSSSAREKNWETLRAAWAAGTGKPYKPLRPPEGAEGVLADDEWVEQALEAIQRLPRCKYFSTPPTLFQFFKSGFVQRVNGGGYDEVTKRPRGQPGEQPTGPPDNSRRKYWRGDAQQNLTDGEYAVWKATHRQEVA